jgi:hypothetical protein
MARLASDAMRNGTDPLLTDLASRECINVARLDIPVNSETPLCQ